MTEAKTVPRSLKNLAKLAKDTLHPDTSTVEGFKQFLKTWYVLQFNTTFKDPVLLSHSFEELIVLYYVHNLHRDATFVDDIIGDKLTEDEEYEEFLRKRMGDDYVSEDEMVDNMVQYEEQEREIAAKLPDRIDTDFSMLGVEDD